MAQIFSSPRGLLNCALHLLADGRLHHARQVAVEPLLDHRLEQSTDHLLQRLGLRICWLLRRGLDPPGFWPRRLGISGSGSGSSDHTSGTGSALNGTLGSDAGISRIRGTSRGSGTAATFAGGSGSRTGFTTAGATGSAGRAFASTGAQQAWEPRPPARAGDLSASTASSDGRDGAALGRLARLRPPNGMSAGTRRQRLASSEQRRERPSHRLGPRQRDLLRRGDGKGGSSSTLGCGRLGARFARSADRATGTTARRASSPTWGLDASVWLGARRLAGPSGPPGYGALPPPPRASASLIRQRIRAVAHC